MGIIKEGTPAWSVLVVGVCLSCCETQLGGRLCAVTGDCLEDFRCRQGVCVPLGPEVCDGEDNDDDGFYDEGVIGADLRQFPLLAPGTPTTDTGVVFAHGRGTTLAAWATEVGTDRRRLFYRQIDDASLIPGAIESVVDYSALGNEKIAVAAAPDGFVIAFAERERADPTATVLRGVRIESLGDVSQWTFGGTQFPIELRTASWAGGTAAVLVEERGVILLTDRGTREIVDANLGQSPRNLLVTPSGDVLAIGWVECGEPALVVGPCAGSLEALPDQVQLRLIRPSGTASVLIERATSPAMSWVLPGSLAAVVWRDLTDRTRPVLRLRMLGADGTWRSDSVEAADVAAPIESIVVTTGSSEPRVLWTTKDSVLATQTLRMVRVSPKLGPDGAPLAQSVEYGLDLAAAGDLDSGGTVAWLSPLGDRDPFLAIFGCGIAAAR